MPNLVSDFWLFVVAVITHWQAYLTGGIAVAATSLYERFTGKPISLRVVLWGVLSFFVGAFFMAWRDEHLAVERFTAESLRPYFALTAPGIKPLPDSPPYRFQILMENTGVHPAIDVEGKIILQPQSLAGEPQVIDFSIANEIPAHSTNAYYNYSLTLPQNLPPQYIVYAIR